MRQFFFGSIDRVLMSKNCGRQQTCAAYKSSIKTVGVTVLGDLWALEGTWHPAETNLRCVKS